MQTTGELDTHAAAAHDTRPEIGRDIAAITALVQEYFTGIHEGDARRVERVFHPDAVLVGDVRGEPYRKTRDEYVEVLFHRPSPASMGAPFAFRLLHVDVWYNAAVVRLHTPVGGLSYVDFLSLQRQGDGWVVTHKLFSHEPVAG